MTGDEAGHFPQTNMEFLCAACHVELGGGGRSVELMRSDGKTTARDDPPGLTERVLQYRVGQDRAGRWVVIEVHGFGRHLFRTRGDAVQFAGYMADGRADAVSFCPGPVERPDA